jgi:hypothetical protein
MHAEETQLLAQVPEQPADGAQLPKSLPEHVSMETREVTTRRFEHILTFDPQHGVSPEHVANAVEAAKDRLRAAYGMPHDALVPEHWVRLDPAGPGTLVVYSTHQAVKAL